MKTSMLKLLVGASLLILSACQKDGEDQLQLDFRPESAELQIHPDDPGQKPPWSRRRFSAARVLNLVDDPGLPKDSEVGRSVIMRTQNGLMFSIRAQQLTPGHVVTIWGVVFNRPGACEGYPDACVGSDLGNPAVMGDAIYGVGGIVGPNGRIYLRGFLREGDATGSMAHEVNTPFPPTGLLNSETAELHLVVRDHGPVIPGQLNEQRSSFAGGCTTSFPPFSAFARSEGECGNIFASIHQPE